MRRLCLSLAAAVTFGGAVHCQALAAPANDRVSAPQILQTRGAQPPNGSLAVPALLSLADAQAIALASSPLLAVARAAVNQTQAEIGINASAQLPNVSVQAASSRSKSSSRSGGGSTAGGVPTAGSSSFVFSSNSASVNLRQLLVDGGRVRAQVNAAKFSTDAARLQLRRQFEAVAFSVAQAYYTALQSRHQLETAQHSLRLAQVQARLVEAQYKAGVAARADVLTAQLPVAQAQLTVIQAANGERTQIAGLLNAMGVPSQISVRLKDDTTVSGSAPSLQVILDTAKQQRPDLQAALVSERAAAENVKAASLGRFPVLSGNANTGLSSTDQSGSNFANNYSVGLGLSFPILDGGLVRSQTALAQAQQQNAQANVQLVQLGVSLNVQQAYLGLQTASAGVTAANAELAQARTVLDVTNAQYRAGVTTLPLLLNAQTGLARAETDQVNALYSYKVAQQQLLLAEGTIIAQP